MVEVKAQVVGAETLIDSQTEVTVFVGGKKVEAKIEYPKGKEITDTSGKYSIYEGTVKITGTFPATDGAVEVHVKLTACKEGTCLLPSVVKVK